MFHFLIVYDGLCVIIGVQQHALPCSISPGAASLDAGLVCTGDWSLVSCCEEISTDLSDCCPKLLKLSDVKYCSDQDVVIVKAKVAGFFEQISLQKASCGNETILDDFLELKALQGEEDSCETQVSLLVDLAPVWHVLETKSYEDERLEALKALRILGGTSPVRTIRTAGPVLFEEEELASLAQEAIAATGCEPQEELQAGTGGIVPSDSSFAWVEFLAVLTQQLRLYETTSPRLVTRRLRPASEVLALLFPKGAVGHGEAFEWLAFVLAEGSQPEQSSALSAFTALIEGEESWSPCVEVLVQRLLQPSLRRDQESQLNEALAIVCRRAPDAVRDVLLTRLTCDDSSPAALARLARSVTFVGTNEELTKALVKHLESMHGTYLVELARGLQEVSSDCKPQVFEALRHELQRRQPPCDHGCEDVVRVIGSCWPVDGVLRELSGYLAQASRRVATEGAGPVAAVLDAASSMASSAAQPLLVRSQMVLARRLRDTGDVVALEALRRSFAAAADEPRGDLWLVIASGFEKPVPLIRNGCKEVFLQMASLWPAGAHATLERCVEEEMVSSTRCFCLQLLGRTVRPRVGRRAFAGESGAPSGQAALQEVLAAAGVTSGWAMAAACGPGGPPSSLLLFGDPAITAPALARSLDALEKVLATPSVTTPKVTGVGGLMAAPAEKGQPAVGETKDRRSASVRCQEGDYRDVAETEKGTAGIPRRVGIPAAAALKAVMQREQIAGPKELLLGLSRPAAMGTSLAEKWALFNWVGVSKAGGCALAGGDPITEKLMPKGTLQSCQCFKVSPALEQWRRLAAQGASLTLALAGGRTLGPLALSMLLILGSDSD
eukprot:g3010.t1